MKKLLLSLIMLSALTLNAKTVKIMKYNKEEHKAYFVTVENLNYFRYEEVSIPPKDQASPHRVITYLYYNDAEQLASDKLAIKEAVGKDFYEKKIDETQDMQIILNCIVEAEEIRMKKLLILHMDTIRIS